MLVAAPVPLLMTTKTVAPLPALALMFVVSE
jgi:hypothetical protein